MDIRRAYPSLQLKGMVMSEEDLPKRVLLRAVWGTATIQVINFYDKTDVVYQDSLDNCYDWLKKKGYKKNIVRGYWQR